MHCIGRIIAGGILSAAVAGVGNAQDITADPALKAKLPEAIASSGKIAIAAFPNPPFNLEQEDKTVVGAAHDLGAAIAKVLGLAPEQSLVASVAAARVGVQSGRYALTLGPTIDSADAEKEADVIPWVKTMLGFLHRADASYKELLDFCGKAIGIVGGSVPLERSMQALAKACAGTGKAEPAVSPFGDQNAMILALEARRVEAVTMSSAAALYAEKMRAPRLRAFTAEGDVFGVGLNSGILMRKTDPQLSEAVLKAMQKLQADGVYAAILAKYNIGALGLAKIELNPLSAGGAR